MRMRKLAVLLALTMVLAAFAGCADGSATTPPSTNPTSGTTPASDGGENKLSGELEIAAFSNGDSMDAFWNKAVEEFKALYPEVKVTLTANPKIEESVRPRFVAGTPPDVYYMGGQANADEAALTAENKFMDLTEFYNTAEAIGYDGLLKDNMAAEVFNTADGKIYGMAFHYGVWGYYYNAAMAREHGWEPPANWADFLELAPKIKEAGIYPIIHQGKYPDYMGYGLMQPGIATDGGKETLVKMGNLDTDTYKSDAVVNAYKKYETIRENDWAPASALSLTHTEAQMEWLQGKAFIIPCGTWLEAEMANDIPDGFEMGFAPSFWFDSGNTPTYVASGARVSVSATTKNPEAAKAFLQVLFSKNVTAAVVENKMGIPCTKDTLEGMELAPSSAAVLKQAAEGKAVVINEVGGSGNFEPYAEQRTVINNNIAAILGGQKTAVEALNDIAAEISRIRDDANIAKVTIS